jgi:hypothetical protein
MRGQLTLRFKDDKDSTGELFATVRQGAFSGAASAWFGVDEVRAFGRALQEQFPLPFATPVTLEGGFWTSEDIPKLDQLHLRLSVYPIGGTGIIGIKVELATQVHARDRPESQCSVTVELQSNYEPLRAFGQGIVALANANEEHVTLIANDA